MDERVIIPRSLIAELMADGSMDYWLKESTQNVLDLCTGSGSLAILAALTYPEVTVTGSDLSGNAWPWPISMWQTRVGGAHHAGGIRRFYRTRVTKRGPFDLILCNPPMSMPASMATLPPSTEPSRCWRWTATQRAADGMDFIRTLLIQPPEHMTVDAVLVLGGW
ncbi:MAG: methyltransferase [Burkholderiales bacterium]|nr:methyltransferase [Burkholderiales bacterium]